MSFDISQENSSTIIEAIGEEIIKRVLTEGVIDSGESRIDQAHWKEHHEGSVTEHNFVEAENLRFVESAKVSDWSVGGKNAITVRAHCEHGFSYQVVKHNSSFEKIMKELLQGVSYFPKS